MRPGPARGRTQTCLCDRGPGEGGRGGPHTECAGSRGRHPCAKISACQRASVSACQRAPAVPAILNPVPPLSGPPGPSDRGRGPRARAPSLQTRLPGPAPTPLLPFPMPPPPPFPLSIYHPFNHPLCRSLSLQHGCRVCGGARHGPVERTGRGPSPGGLHVGDASARCRDAARDSDRQARRIQRLRRS